MKNESPLQIVPQQIEMPGLPPSKRQNKNLAEAMRDPSIPIAHKLRTIGLVCSMPFINGLSKADLHAMLKVSYAVPDEAETGDNYYMCGNCECAVDERYQYCPMCGRKIGKGEDEEEE